MCGQNSKHKSALAALDAVTKFVKEIPAIDGDSLNALFLSFNKARSAFLTEDTPAPYGVAAALGVGGWFYKTAKSEKDASDEPKKEGKAEQSE